MNDQPDSSKPAEQTSVLFNNATEHKVSGLRDMKKQQVRSVLHMQDDDDTMAVDASNQAHMIAVDLDVDHSGTSVYLRGRSVVQTPYPPIVLVHDFASNSSNYRTACDNLVAKGFSTYSFDLRGHGRSGRVLGHIPNFHVLVSDLLQVAAWVKYREDGRAPIIVTHGLSALVAAQFQQKHRKFCAGVVLVAPTIQLLHRVSAFQGFCVSLAADIYPYFKIPRRLIPRFSSPVKVMSKAGITQHINPMRMSAKFTHEIYQALELGPSKLMKLKIPSLILLPENDQIVNLGIIKEVLERHKQPELITVVTVPDTQHNMITEHENNLDAGLALIEGWVKEKISLTKV